jgi:hypothetical protein
VLSKRLQLRLSSLLESCLSSLALCASSLLSFSLHVWSVKSRREHSLEGAASSICVGENKDADETEVV